mgnify:CR=1 FL=1
MGLVQILESIYCQRMPMGLQSWQNAEICRIIYQPNWCLTNLRQEPCYLWTNSLLFRLLIALTKSHRSKRHREPLGRVLLVVRRTALWKTVFARVPPGMWYRSGPRWFLNRCILFDHQSTRKQYRSCMFMPCWRPEPHEHSHFEWFRRLGNQNCYTQFSITVVEVEHQETNWHLKYHQYLSWQYGFLPKSNNISDQRHNGIRDWSSQLYFLLSRRNYLQYTQLPRAFRKCRLVFVRGMNLLPHTHKQWFSKPA